MSTGGIIGGVVGGIVGFVYGGPVGAVYGFGIGMGIGSYIDPISSSSNIGAPKIQELAVTTAKEGDVIPDLLGLSKLAGNIIMYWGERSIEVKETQEGGKGGGGSSTVITGHQYYLSWLQCLCIGPVDYLYTIYMNDDVVWIGELKRPESGGEVTITLVNYSDSDAGGETIGNLTFYFGSADHALNTKFEAGLSDPTLNTPYRQRCYAFFDDCLLGPYNRVPVFKFVMAKRPEFSFSALNTINKYDYNAAHAIYYWLTNSVDLPTSFIDEDSFSEVALTLSSESFGISVLMDKSVPANTYIDNLLFHINGIKFYDVDKKLHIKLLRPDVDKANMPSISESNLISEPSIKRGSWAETINDIKGIFPLRIGGEFIAADIFGLFSVGSLIWGVRFDGINLIELGYYESPSGDINGLIIKDDELVTIGGDDVTASIRRVSMIPSDGLLPLIEETTPFNTYDVTKSANSFLTYDAVNDIIYYNDACSLGEGGRILKIDSNLSKELRSFIGTVTQGTDGNLYIPDKVYSNWTALNKPITGTNWSAYNSIIPDNISDRDIQPWGIGTLYTNASTGIARYIIHKGYLFGYTITSPHSYIKRYDLSDLDLLDNEKTENFPYGMTALDNFIFTVEGAFSCVVRRYTDIPLGLALESEVLPVGRASDIITVGSELIVLNEPYTGDGAIYKINPSTLEVVEYTNLGTTLWQRIAYINETFVALGGNNWVGVFNIIKMEMVDVILAPTPPSGSHYTTRDLITKEL